MEENKGNVNRRTDYGEKTAFTEKIWKIEEEM